MFGQVRVIRAIRESSRLEIVDCDIGDVPKRLVVYRCNRPGGRPRARNCLWPIFFTRFIMICIC